MIKLSILQKHLLVRNIFFTILFGLSFGLISTLPSQISAQTVQSVAQIYMSPNGDDLNDGLSTSKSVKTLERVKSIIETARPNYNVTVNIAPGLYVGQTVEWTYTMPNNSITFRSTSNNLLDRPVFQKCKGETTKCSPDSSTWFTLRQSDGKNSNLSFKNLHIRFYQTAISFNGNRSSPTSSNGHNYVTNMLFESIGGNDSTAVVRFVNSKSNTVKNNQFIRGPGNQVLHAVYLAHYSSDNVISDNRFEQISGDPIRVRDQSNNAVITNNTFVRNSNGTAVSLWFCNTDIHESCTKADVECPSSNIKVQYNTWDKRELNAKKSAVSPVFDRVKSDGSAKCPSIKSARFSTSGNIVSNDLTCDFNGKKILHGQKVTAYISPTSAPGEPCVSQSRTCSMGALFGTYKYPSCSKN